MTNSLMFIRNKDSFSTEDLNNLAANLNASGVEINYYFSVLKTIAEKHHAVKVRNEAKIYLTKEQNIQDDLDFLNSCIFFLRRQLNQPAGSNTLSAEQIKERKMGLAEDIAVFIEINQSIQRACLRFTNDYFHNPFGQANRAA